MTNKPETLDNPQKLCISESQMVLSDKNASCVCSYVQLHGKPAMLVQSWKLKFCEHRGFAIYTSKNRHDLFYPRCFADEFALDEGVAPNGDQALASFKGYEFGAV